MLFFSFSKVILYRFQPCFHFLSFFSSERFWSLYIFHKVILKILPILFSISQFNDINDKTKSFFIFIQIRRNISRFLSEIQINSLTAGIYFKSSIKTKKLRRVLEFSQSHWLKRYVEFNRDKKKRIEAEQHDEKYGKVLHKTMNNAVLGKTNENVRNRISLKLVKNKKVCLKWTWKTKLHGV